MTHGSIKKTCEAQVKLRSKDQLPYRHQKRKPKTYFKPSAPAYRNERQHAHNAEERGANLERDEHNTWRSNERFSFDDVERVRLSSFRNLAQLDRLSERCDDILSFGLRHATVESSGTSKISERFFARNERMRRTDK